MIGQSVLLFVIFVSSARAFAINDANTFRAYHRFKRSVSVSTPNLIQINNELSEWHLTENNSLLRNDLLIGQCGNRDQRVYTDDILVENSGPSMLNGTIEIYVDSQVAITCVKVEDQIEDGTGAIPTYNSGGPAHNWIFIDVKCRYGKGFHFKIHIYGKPQSSTANKDVV